MKTAIIILLTLLVSFLYFSWHEKQVEACAFARGVDAVKRSVVNLNGKPVLSGWQWQLSEGDYRACFWAGEEL